MCEKYDPAWEFDRCEKEERKESMAAIFADQTITIRLTEYKELLSDGEKLKILTDYVTDESYPKREVISKILGIKEE